MKNLLYLCLCLLATQLLKAQDTRPPDIIVPTVDGSEDYLATYYSPGKTYTCEQWLSTYMQYYHSNHSKDVTLSEPIYRYAEIQGEVEATRTGRFHFAIRKTQIFSANTPPALIEDFLMNYEATRAINSNKFQPYLKDAELVFAGLILPHELDDIENIRVALDESEPTAQEISYLRFFDEYGVEFANLNTRTGSTSFILNERQALNMGVEIGLKNGLIYHINYQHQQCKLGPPIKKMKPPFGPKVPPPPPPVEPVIVPVWPELDEECNIIPTYYNQPTSTLPYVAEISMPTPDSLVFTSFYEVVDIIDLGYGEFQEVWSWVSRAIPSPYTTTVNRGVHGPLGEIRTAVYLNPYHNKLKKPIIVTDGIDFLSNRNLKDIVEHFGGNDMISLLWDGGYDVVIADFAGGADFIQRNAFALCEMLRSMKQDQGVEEIEAIIGPSMGGQIVRYALMYWEQNLQANYGSHNVNIFVSADSPWSGANASPAVQAFAEGGLNNNNTIMTINNSVNSPAARQLLLHHTYGRIFSGFDPDLYSAGSHIYKTLLDDELDNLGFKPLNVKKIISIADGSGSGVSNNVLPGNEFLDILFKNCINLTPSSCDIRLLFNGISEGDFLVEKEVTSNLAPFICTEIAKGYIDNLKTQGSLGNYDSTPGSPFNLDQYLMKIEEGLIVYNSSGITAKIEDVNFNSTFTFIPTFSALGLNQSQAFTNLFEIVTPTTNGYILPGSPFDFVYFDDKDSDHNDFSVDQQPGSIPFLLSNLNYQKEYETKCMIMENLGLENEEIVIDPTQQQANNEFCFPFEVTNVVVPVQPDCGIETTLYENHLILNAAPSPDDCETNFELCVDVAGCGEICYDLKVTVLGEGNQRPEAEEEQEDVLLLTSAVASSIKVFPNPTTGIINLYINAAELGLIEVKNSLGRTVGVYRPMPVIDLSALPNGVYTLIFTDKGRMKIKELKLIIVK
ncbi:MAG: T9SS type A sorting domain-containing protein [Saprospiraceae bacterium]|nr:T9SS type A sorting domain-containing protein [Saprospiraceae bacterium]